MEREIIILLETTLDHLTGEEIGAALEHLNSLPTVLDALFLPGIGKKNRPAGLLQTLVKPENEHQICLEIFRHTHSLGIRRSEMTRYVLKRCAATTNVNAETVPAKAYELENETYIRPEADALKKLAEKKSLGAPALRIQKLS